MVRDLTSFEVLQHCPSAIVTSIFVTIELLNVDRTSKLLEGLGSAFLRVNGISVASVFSFLRIRSLVGDSQRNSLEHTFETCTTNLSAQIFITPNEVQHVGDATARKEGCRGSTDVQQRTRHSRSHGRKVATKRSQAQHVFEPIIQEKPVGAKLSESSSCTLVEYWTCKDRVESLQVLGKILNFVPLQCIVDTGQGLIVFERHTHGDGLASIYHIGKCVARLTGELAARPQMLKICAPDGAGEQRMKSGALSSQEDMLELLRTIERSLYVLARLLDDKRVFDLVHH